MDDEMWTYPCRDCDRYSCRCTELAGVPLSYAAPGIAATVREWTPSWWTATACNA
jgi:hypothetical protein